MDYVLWGDDGKPLGLVEAKRTRRDPQAGQQQAKLYAALCTAAGKRLIFAAGTILGLGINPRHRFDKACHESIILLFLPTLATGP